MMKLYARNVIKIVQRICNAHLNLTDLDVADCRVSNSPVHQVCQRIPKDSNGEGYQVQPP